MAKDWKGDANSVYKTLGATNHATTERQCDDYYATDPIAIDKLLEVYQPPHYIWEPSCGEGHLSKRLLERGYHVLSSDIADRGYGYVRMDFLAETSLPEVMQGGGLLHHHQPTVQVCHGVCRTCAGTATRRRTCHLSIENTGIGGQKPL